MGFTAAATTRFANRCTAMAPGTTNSGTGPATSTSGGYHNSRNRLYQLGKTNDYSVRYPWDKNGNGDCWCAFDWGMPDQYTISLYMRRVRDAYYRRDPRLTGWREILGAIDGVLIAFNCAPNDWYTRVPDSSHLTHIHFSVLREFVEEEWVYNNMMSILEGQSLEAWKGTDMAEFTDRQVEQIDFIDKYLWRGYAGLEDIIPIGANGIENKGGKAIKATLAQVQATGSAVTALAQAVQALKAQNDGLKAELELLKDMYTAPQPVQLNFDQLRAALTDPAFLASLAEAVNDDAAQRMAE